jgi:Mg2+/citrate symporter
VTTTEIIFLLCLIIICGIVVILIIKWSFTAKENRELKQENRRNDGRIKDLSSLLKSEEEISKAHFDKTIQLSLEKAELQSRVDKFNISQE